LTIEYLDFGELEFFLAEEITTPSKALFVPISFPVSEKLGFWSIEYSEPYLKV